jgi:hypothetical protein
MIYASPLAGCHSERSEESNNIKTFNNRVSEKLRDYFKKVKVKAFIKNKEMKSGQTQNPPPKRLCYYKEEETSV